MHLRNKRRTSKDLPWVNVSALVILGGFLAPAGALWLRDPSFFGEGRLFSALVYIGVSGVFTALSFLWFGVSHSSSRFFTVADGFIIFKASAVAVLCAVFFCFFVTRLDDIPRSAPLIHFIVLTAGMVGFRSESQLRRQRRNKPRALNNNRKNTLIIGVSDLSFLYTQIIEQFAFSTDNVVGFLDDRLSLQGRFIQGYPVAGRVRDLEQVLNEYDIHGVKIDRIVVAESPPDDAPAGMQRILAIAAAKGVSVEQLPERLGISAPGPQQAEEAPVGKPEPEAAGQFWRLKRAIDFVAALCFLIVATPIAAVVSALVFIDCGTPIYFWQVRIGRYGRRIIVYKFRTLRSPYTAQGEHVPHDRRASLIGRFLRLTHLDEMPQVLSILTGDMSFIGPRPLLPIDLSSDAWLRFAVRPGITGWAQIHGATLLTNEEKNAMDEWYVRHASLAVELKIVFRTIAALLYTPQRDEARISEALEEKRRRASDES